MTFEEIIQEEKKLSFDDGVKQGISKGREEGISQGISQGKYETAAAFLKMGLSVEQVALGTGLTVEEIRKLNTY